MTSGFFQVTFHCQAVGLLRRAVVPADVLVAAEHVEILAQRVINHLRVRVAVTPLVGGGQQPRRVERARVVDRPRRNFFRGSLTGVSLATDQRMTEGAFLSRVMFSLSWFLAFA